MPRTAPKAPRATTARARADSEGGKGGAGQRPVMRNNDGSINYLLGDHLGSVSTVVNANGEIVSQSRYLLFGEVLWEDGTSPTDYTYTGSPLQGRSLPQRHWSDGLQCTLL